MPASKSIEQRVIALAALADRPPRIVRLGDGPPGDDVLMFSRAVALVGPWSDGAWGSRRDRITLDLGLGATGFRLSAAMAVLRPTGARTLVSGRPALLARPHLPLRRALARLGAKVKRRHSGSLRVLGGGARGGPAYVDGTRSSQFATALAMIAPRLGGMSITVTGPVVSAPYLDLTRNALTAFGITAAWMPRGRDVLVEVAGGAPRADEVVVPPDASAAVARYAAAALGTESVVVPGLRRDASQPDLRVFDVLEAMGARIETDARGDVRVTGTGERLRAADTVDLRSSPDLLPVLAALAATADGVTRFVGAPHLQHKETDRRATVAAGLAALGGRVETTTDGLVVRGAALHGGDVRAAGDHRVAAAFAVLARHVAGVRLHGASVVAKSDPHLLDDLGPTVLQAAVER